MAEIEARHKGLIETLDKIELAIEKTRKKKRSEDIRKCNDMLKRAQRDLGMIRMETRVLPKEAHLQWVKPLKKTEKRLKGLSREMEWLKSGDDVDNENPSSRRQKSNDLRPPDPRKITEGKLQRYGQRVMKDTERRTDNVLVMIDDAKETGARTSAQLHQQTQQLQTLHDDVYMVEGELQRAKVVLKRMGRRAVTDKYLSCLVFLILIAIVFIIIYEITNKQDEAQEEKPVFTNT